MMRKHHIASEYLCVSVILLCFLAACAISPDNSQIEAAIRLSLSEEASPPELDLDSMDVQLHAFGNADAVVWTADREIQRNYYLRYNKAARAFKVTDFTVSKRKKDGTYYPVPNDTGLVLTELAPYFDFSDDFSQKYILLYAGEGDDISTLRTAFESEKLSGMTAEQLASFEVCDLGGDTLVLLVPRYKGLAVWINELEHRGDVMRQGAEVSRFESGLPVYIYCSFSDKLPEHEIHIYFDEQDEFFLTREALLTNIK